MRKVVRENYICPEVEVVKTPAFNLLLPHSWDPDFNPENPDPTLPIIEGDPEGNGKGANHYGLLDFDDANSNGANGGYDPWANL